MKTNRCFVVSITIVIYVLMGSLIAYSAIQTKPPLTELKPGLSIIEKVPDPPSKMEAHTMSTTAINLVWNQTPDFKSVGGFKVERKTANGSFQIVSTIKNSSSSKGYLFVSSAPNTSAFIRDGVMFYIDRGLTPDTTYTYRVAAYNIGGNSAYSSEVSATTNGVAPVAPTNLQITAVSTTQLNVSWQPNSELSKLGGFKIERKKANETFSTIATIIVSKAADGSLSVSSDATNNKASLTNGTLLFTNDNLEYGGTYVYRIMAYNKWGNSPYTAEVTVRTQGVAPTIPSNFSAYKPEYNQLWLSWKEDVTTIPITGFRLERVFDNSVSTVVDVKVKVTYNPGPIISLNRPPNMYGSIIYEYSENKYTFKFPQVGLGEDRKYRIVVYNNMGETPSNDLAVHTAGGAPEVPSNFQANPISNYQVNLSWKLDLSANKYDYISIERKTGDGEYQRLPSVAISSYLHRSSSITSNNATYNYTTKNFLYTDLGLIPGTTYTYRIRSRNTHGDSAYTPEVTAKTFSGTAPAAPGNVQCQVISRTQINLSWQQFPNYNNIDGFKIERKTNSGQYITIAMVKLTISNNGIVVNSQTAPNTPNNAYFDSSTGTFLYTDMALTQGNTYTYHVIAYNGSGSSGYTEVSATPN